MRHQRPITGTLTATLLCLALAGTPAFAQQDISKVNGSVTAASAQPFGDLSTVNGSIRIEDRATGGDASTVNGSIKAGDGIGAGSLSTVNGSIRTGTGATLSGSASTVNGSIFIDRGSKVGRGIETVNGAIGVVSTVVDGNIETVNGDITVGIGSHVRGGIKVNKPSSNWLPIQVNRRKPRIIIGPDAVVDGTLVFEREVTLYVHDSARTGAITGATPVAFSSPRAPQD